MALLFMVVLFRSVAGIRAMLTNPVGWSILASGVIGGWTLSKLMRFVRARWKWWTRWED